MVTIHFSKNKRDNVEEKDSIRTIPILLPLTKIILQIIQTQDVFHIRFYPENNHLDICIYEFVDFKDLYYEVKERLCELNIDPLIRYQILLNISRNKDRITRNLQYFGVAHIYD